MEILLKVVIPIMMVGLLYLILRVLNKKESQSEFFVKLRILFGCIGVGIFLCLAYSSPTIRTAIPFLLLSLLVFYGVVVLQKKYLSKN